MPSSFPPCCLLSSSYLGSVPLSAYWKSFHLVSPGWDPVCLWTSQDPCLLQWSVTCVLLIQHKADLFLCLLLPCCLTVLFALDKARAHVLYKSPFPHCPVGSALLTLWAHLQLALAHICSFGSNPTAFLSHFCLLESPTLCLACSGLLLSWTSHTGTCWETEDIHLAVTSCWECYVTLGKFMDHLVSILTWEPGIVEMRPPGAVGSEYGSGSGGDHGADAGCWPPHHPSPSPPGVLSLLCCKPPPWLRWGTLWNKSLRASLEVLTLSLLLPVPALGLDPAPSLSSVTMGWILPSEDRSLKFSLIHHVLGLPDDTAPIFSDKRWAYAWLLAAHNHQHSQGPPSWGPG